MAPRAGSVRAPRRVAPVDERAEGRKVRLPDGAHRVAVRGLVENGWQHVVVQEKKIAALIASHDSVAMTSSSGGAATQCGTSTDLASVVPTSAKFADKHTGGTDCAAR